MASKTTHVRGKRKMQGNVESDVVKWLLCRLMLKQGYSETDVAEQMKLERPQRVEVAREV
jgi:hypothetical protein